jgi:hypothetical protein
VIATGDLLDQPRALLALLHVLGVLPVLDLLAEGAFAAGLGVRLAIASVADHRRALGALARLLLRVGVHHHRALGVGAPLQVGVLVDLQVAQELPVLHVGRPVHQLLDEVVGEAHSAMGAGQSLDPHVADLTKISRTSSFRYISMHWRQISCTSPLILTMSCSTTSM